MPLFSEHISNMYYSGSPSYTSPSYGYKSSYIPLGTSYSAAYLNPGGSYSNHSSISSYSRAPLSSRWIPGLSRSYSPMLTPISERGTASPIRINSPRRIPLSKRCYGAPSYIQRPININTESIDVSRNRYRPKPAETAQPASAFLPRPQNDDLVKDNEKSPFMPRIDGKPETGIDSSPGLQRSTIKRGRTVVRLHTIKRKDKDSPRKPIETSQLQDCEINTEDASETLADNIIPEEPKEPLRWREKLSEDLVYVDKKEKKSLGTKLVEKFIVKDTTEKDNKIDKSDMRSSEGASRSFTEMLSPSSEAQSTSKSPDRRCSVELLAEQSSLLDSLIRGENLSTATLDLSKVGIADETKNKLVSSNSIKRRKTDDKGNPLKTTKSDHSLHDNLKKSLKGNKDSKTLTKRRSLKKSQSGGSIYRLDSITEFPKEPVDLPAIPENKLSPKETKTEQKPKLRTKITTSVEISPPISPLKFRIENVIVEEKHHAPKKEISFSYDVDEIPTQDVTLQGPKTALRRTKERNSVKKKSKKVTNTDPISPEPDDGNFWAKIGKRETVYLIKRKQNIEAAREEKKRAYFWLDGDDEESGDVSNVTNDSNVSIDTSNDSVNTVADSELPIEPEPNIIPPKAKKVNIGDKKDGNFNTVSTKLEKSRSSDSIQNIIANTHSSSLKENTTKNFTEPKHDDETSIKQTFHLNAEIKKDVTLNVEEKNETEKSTESNLREKTTLANQIDTNLKIQETVPPEISKTVSPPTKTVSFDEPANTNTDFSKDLKQKLEVSEDNEIVKSKISLNLSVEAPGQLKTTFVNSTVTFKTQGESDQKNLEKDSKPTVDNIEKTKVNFNLNSYPETLSQPDSIPAIKAPVLKTPAKSEGKNEKDSKPISEKTETIETKIHAKLSAETSIEKETKPVNTAPIKQSQAKNEDKNLEKNLKPLLSKKTETIASAKADADVNLAAETLPNTETKPINIVSTSQTQAKSEGNDLENNSKTILEQSETSNGSKYNTGHNVSTEAKPKPVISLATLQTQAKNENKNLDRDLLYTPEKLGTVDSAKTNFIVNTSGQSLTESKAKITNVSTLQAQAKRKVDEKKIEPLAINKQLEKTEDVNTNIKKQRIPESLKKTVSTDTTKVSSKKKIKKVQVMTPEKNDGLIIEKLSSDPKDNVCETCKKSLGSDSNKNNKVNIKRIKDQSTTKPLQGKDKFVEINTGADKSIKNEKEAKSSLDSSAANSSNFNSKPETSASTSQIPIVIETKNIPNETVPSDTDQVQTSVPSQEKIGEENKSENDTKLEENPKVKQSSIKKVTSPKKLIKEDKPLKPLIATPRPLLKRVPQVIHSDSSESSSEDSSEEEESDESENSGEFFECENNPDGRTSTGSNDSGFDSSAPTSPASFLHIKKGGGDSPGPSSSNTPSQLPATDVVDSELELEQSTAYGLFRKTGRFTPPARSIPRFRKYNIEDFQFIKVLGKGSFGKVLLAELRDTEYYYAVKCLKKDVVLEDDDVECTLIERKVLALGTNHPYLCHLFATFQTDSHLFFVMEYLNGGDLMFHIQQSGRFPEARARFYAAEIVSGLKFLHKRGIVYRDLKLDNILLDFDGNVRIADFGMCKLQIYLDKTADTFCGTPDYMAPEIIKGLKYNQTVDWWSFGVLLYEMLIGQSPFSGCDEDELFWSICNEMPSYPRFLSREALTILTRLLDKDAKTRLGGTECMHGDVREQDFFHPVHWDKLERRELETPFKPRVRHPLDTQYFDRAFTGERPRLTAVEPHVLRSMDQEPFRGFSYTNPNATDR